jgi:CDP-glycerol glycerophosphotransferase (TagB/SpsB family)
MNRNAAIHTGPFTHLDHLVPVCLKFDLPLIVIDDRAYAIGKEFYPQVQLQLMDPADLSLDFLASSFDTIYTCGKFWALELRPLLELFQSKQMRFVFCPHGNSDKEALLKEHYTPISQDSALVYGPQMEALMKGSAEKLIPIGNLRQALYSREKAHFDRLFSEKIQLNPSKKTILYAPTWETKATGSSFFSSASSVIDQLHGEYNLLIKPHPLLEESHPAHYYRMEGKCASLPDVHFIDAFPAIYPILEQTDVYLGDHSSVGYDFLFYNRPMFFFSDKEGGLQSCGELVKPEELKQKIRSDQREFMGIREKIYQQAFGKSPTFTSRTS